MSDDDFKLTHAQRMKVEAHIDSKATLIGKCSVCGERKWGLLDHFVTLPIYYPDGGFRIPGGRYPNVGLICHNCGHTQLINAYVAGALPALPAAEASKEDGND